MPQPGRLLEAVGREVHQGREVTELGLGLPAQGHLGERGGDAARLGRPPQLGLGPQRVLGRLGGPGEQLLAVVGEQPAEVVEVHAAILSEAARADAPGALALHRVEC